MRIIKDLNFQWSYKNNINDEKYEIVNLPHTNVELPYNNFDEKLYCFVSQYNKELEILEEYKEKDIFICFEGVATYAKVYINENFAGEHKGGYTPFEININEYVRYGEKNELKVIVDSNEREEIPPFGNVIDYLTYGGIYREVFLKVVDKNHIENIFIKTKNVLQNNKSLELDITISNFEEGNTADFKIYDKDSNIVEMWTSNLTARNSSIIKEISNVEKWDIDNPNLYKLEIVLKNSRNNLCDKVEEKFGFREAVFKTDGFYLNGKKIKIRGLNRHQSFANVGYAMPKSMQEKDAEILKLELGCNLVRTSHYPQSRHFLNRCDEIGLLVFTEIPGWQHISNIEEWRKIVLQNVEEMIVRDRNHPSVILWGVRINESQDDDELYNDTNELAHELDDTRQTGGVRNFSGSNILEDVYTYNDFVHRGNNNALDSADKISKSKEVPYLVTEHNGHMFPTKRFDHEKKRLEHALRHMRVLNEMYGSDRISGAIGWCMADYNTHKDFGSGDKICYHGVMDMFRIPKLAAAVYSSQQDKEVVMEVASNMDIGEHAAGELGPVYVFTNCDYIKLYKNNKLIGSFYPDKENFKNVPHPPVLIDDLIGPQLETEENFTPKNAKLIKSVLLDVSKHGLQLPLTKKIKFLYTMVKTKITMNQGVDLYGKYIGNWGGNLIVYKFEGYKNDTIVKVSTMSSVTRPCLEVTVDKNVLIEDKTYDATRIVVKAICENGNVLPFANDVIKIKVDGPIELIGEDAVALIGGVRGIYIKTKGEEGKAKITITTKYLGEYSLDIDIIKIK